MNIEIRDEKPSDAVRIHRVIESAFANAPHTSHTEQFIVKSLRECNALAVSLVAEVDGEILGHVALSPVDISDGATGWYGLGPIAVIPECQGRGIGSQLMKKALVSMEARGAAGCVVLGEPDYYGRFGFRAVANLIFPGVPPEYFQALSFGGDLPRGEVSFHKAFTSVA